MSATQHLFQLVLLLLLVPLLVVPILLANGAHGANRSYVELPRICGHYRPRPRHSSPNRINSGYSAQEAEFPSFVHLGATLSHMGGHVAGRCGGTILTSRHILTAAHCLLRLETPDMLEVATGPGGHMSARYQETYSASKFCPSPRYRFNPNHDPYGLDPNPLSIYDVAIVKLSRPILFDYWAQPVCLPDRPLELATSGAPRQAFAIGLGLTHWDPTNNFTVRATRLQVLPVQRVACSVVDRHESVLCAMPSNQYHPGRICPGDSGSPLIAVDDYGRQIVYGIASYTANRCLPVAFMEDSGWFADVYNIRPEIERLLEECA